VTPDLSKIFSGNWKGRSGMVRDATSGDLLLELAEPHVVGAFSPDGSAIIIGTGTTFTCYETSEWRVRWRRERANTDDLAGPIEFSPDGGVVALGHSRFDVHLAEAASGTTILAIESPNDQAVGDFGFSDHGDAFVLRTNDTTAALYDFEAIRSRLDEIGLEWPESLAPGARRSP